jgi:hypothetical protein
MTSAINNLRDGHPMIREIEIKNFKCFDHLKIENCRRINVIVGDNGSGKTALLEAIFLALGSSGELVLRYRLQRGLDGVFAGEPRRIEEAIWRDYFHQRNWQRIVSINLIGDGPETRSVMISRGKSQISIPLSEEGGAEVAAPIAIEWRDSKGETHQVFPKLTSKGIQFEDSGEDNPFLYFAANQNVSSRENAERFSELSRERRSQEFIDLVCHEYIWLEDLDVEVVAGSPIIYATIRDQPDRLPLPNVSGGVNRLVSVLLGLARQPRSIVLVDEIENGLYYKHQTAFWRGLLLFARKYEGQLFVTTHNVEWLDALAEAAGEKSDDIALWRMERTKEGPVLHQFSGKSALAGVEAGEVR